MAKTLYLVRHAKSSWAEKHLNDFDRPLNTRGLQDAPMMGKRLHARGVQPDFILCSTALRTRETCNLLTREMGLSMEAVEFNDRIYEAPTGTLLQLIQALQDTCSSAMIIGHNPSIGWLANTLSDVRIDRMPTCAIASLSMDTSHWKDVGMCAGRLLDFDYPKREPN